MCVTDVIGRPQNSPPHFYFWNTTTLFVFYLFSVLTHPEMSFPSTDTDTGTDTDTDQDILVTGRYLVVYADAWSTHTNNNCVLAANLDACFTAADVVVVPPVAPEPAPAPAPAPEPAPEPQSLVVILLVLVKQLLSNGTTHGYLLLTRVNSQLVLLHTSIGKRRETCVAEETIGVASLRAGHLVAPLVARATGYHHDVHTGTASSFYTVREEKTPAATHATDDDDDDDDNDRTHAELIAALRFCIRRPDDADERVNLFAAYVPHSTSRAWVTRLEIDDNTIVVHRTHEHLVLCSADTHQATLSPLLPSYLPVVCRAGFVTQLLDVEVWGDNFRAAVPAPFSFRNCWFQIRAKTVYDVLTHDRDGANTGEAALSPVNRELAVLANFYVTGGIEPCVAALATFELKNATEKLVPCTDRAVSIYHDIIHTLTHMARSSDPSKWLNEVEAGAAIDEASASAHNPLPEAMNPLVRAIAYRRARDIRQRVITPDDLLNRLRNPFLSFRECDGFIFDVLFQAGPATLHDFATVASLPNEWNPREFYASGDTGFLSMLYLLQWRSTLQRLLELVLVAELPGMRLFIDSLMNNFRVGIVWQTESRSGELPTYSTLRVLHDPSGVAAKEQYLFLFNPSRLAMVLKPYNTGNLGAIVPPTWVVTGSLQTQCAKQRDSVVAFFVAQAVSLIAQVCNAHVPNPSLESVLIGMYLGTLQEVDLKHTYKHWQRVIRELRQTIPSKNRRVPKPAAAPDTRGKTHHSAGAGAGAGGSNAKRIKLEHGVVKTPPAPPSLRNSIRTLFQIPRARPPAQPVETPSLPPPATVLPVDVIAPSEVN